ncbi:MAG: DUF1800 domain-containing protein [Planctomycetota bacterium]|jgi:uncharacterized protein (DUF1800 family)|nr:DUF1800 domain-containing protein [Planctomycetota bacterium]
MSLITSVLVFCASAGPGDVPQSPPRLPAAEFSRAHAKHLLLRAGFGGTPEQIDRLHAAGLKKAVNWLVDYEKQPDLVGPHGVVPGAPMERGEFGRMDEDERRKVRQQRQRTDRAKMNGLRNWWMGRMLATNRPLEEKITLFWHGHFTSGYRDVKNTFHMALQNDLLRAHATGNFKELVHEIARDPAMLEYLDNNRNNLRAPNENFARELMELFTLGEGNYTEKDIKEAARAFTGWTFNRNFGYGASGVFTFNRGNHDYGKKTFLGQEGRFNGDDIINTILAQDEAPRHIAGKILKFFAVDPTDAEVEPYAALLRNSNWEIKPLLRALFTSEWFYSDRVRGRQIKSPIMLLVNFLRSSGAEPANTSLYSGRTTLTAAADAIGQHLFQPPNVKGWDGGAAWVTSSNLLSRYNITRALIAGQTVNSGSSSSRRPSRSRGNASSRGRQSSSPSFSIYTWVEKAGVKTADEIIDLFTARFLAIPLSAKSRSALIDFLEGSEGGKPLDLTDRRSASTKLNEALHLLTTTPEFQIC